MRLILRYTALITYLAVFAYNIHYVFTPVIAAYGWSNMLLTFLVIFLLGAVCTFAYLSSFNKPKRQATRRPFNSGSTS